MPISSVVGTFRRPLFKENADLWCRELEATSWEEGKFSFEDNMVGKKIEVTMEVFDGAPE